VSADELRDELRVWLAANWSDDITVREWWRRLADARSPPDWPGSRPPLSRSLARAVTEEPAAAGAIAI
jgi:hypothetical protein